MPKLKFDEDGERFFEAGVENVVLYPKTGTNGAYATGVAWNGVTEIANTAEGGEPTPIYADNITYLNLMSVERATGSITAYTYPDEWGVCDGSAEIADGVKIGQQPRKAFGLVYKTKVGNDEDGEDHAYKLHLVYGCLASPAERTYSTIGEETEPIEMSWDFTTTPVPVTGFKPTSHIEIDSRTADADKLEALINKLYGTDGEGSTAGTDPTLVDPDTVKSMMAPTSGGLGGE